MSKRDDENSMKLIRNIACFFCDYLSDVCRAFYNILSWNMEGLFCFSVVVIKRGVENLIMGVY